MPRWFGLFFCTIVPLSLSPSCHYIQFAHSQAMQAPPIQIYCHAKIHDMLGNIPFVTFPSFISQPDPCSRFFFNQGFQFEADVSTPPSEPSRNPCHEGRPLVVQDENTVPTGCGRPRCQRHPTELGLTHGMSQHNQMALPDMQIGTLAQKIATMQARHQKRAAHQRMKPTSGPPRDAEDKHMLHQGLHF